MNPLDTNVLFYTNDSREPQKQQTAKELVGNLKNTLLLWQVACEYVAASRKLEKFGFTPQDAFGDLELLQKSWKIALPTWRTLQKSQILITRYSVSFWDALIVAACIENGVTKFYSEDIGNFFHAENLEIINPFE